MRETLAPRHPASRPLKAAAQDLAWIDPVLTIFAIGQKSRHRMTMGRGDGTGCGDV